MAVTDAIAARAAGSADVACAHCALAVPAGLVATGGGRSFCCSGCEAAWHVLHASGLEAYYSLPDRSTAAARPSGRSFDEFDHPAFADLYVRRRADGLAETDLYLEGVHCAACVWLVERLPRLAPGCARAEVELPRSRVHVEWDPASVTLSALARGLDRLGYRPHPFRGVRAEQARRDEDRAMLSRIGVSGGFAVNVMMVAVALWAGWFSGMERDVERYFRWAGLLLATPALLWPGSVFFRSAWGSLRARTLHMDVPIAVALAAGWIQGVVNTVRGEGPVYFDGLAMLVFLLLVGRFLQTRAQRAAADSSELLHALAPSAARVVAGGGAREVPAAALLPGMVVEVRPGETLPADGAVSEGRSDLDLSFLTGESRPVEVAPGAEVFAGAVNRSATIRVRVEVAGEATRVGRLLRAVEEGARRRAPVVRLADRMSGAFVGATLMLAALTALLWLSRDPARAMDAAIAVLVVTCPCALALATPLAVSVAIGRAARTGILVKGGDALEALSRPGTMLLDKTGTLTEGRTTLARWEGPDWVKPLVLALERDAAHPIARGFAAAWPGVEAPAADAATHTAGGGVEGVVDGHRVAVGSPAFAGARLAAGAPGARAFDDATLTPVVVVVDGRAVARAGFGDPLREDAASSLARLRALGWRLRLLSGDDPRVAAAVGERLGFARGDAIGGASPERKREVVEEEVLRGETTMVGDGINDAVAIARATVGIGVRGGAEACVNAADVYLAKGGLAPLVALVEGARRTLGAIRVNIAFSLAYNVAGVALAMAGYIHPVVAAILMPASSLTVVLVSWLAPTFGREDA